MKIAILTFQFAHNYGAQLQCYALKKYLEENNNTVQVSDYIPRKVIDIYRLWPKLNLKHPRSCAREIVRACRRKEQYIIFDNFIKSEILTNTIDSPDLVVIGSDQVWNEEITGEIEYYYGSEFDKYKVISYAGSFGTSELTEFQIHNIKRFFPRYQAISLRESCNINDVQKLCNKKCNCVVDPVFLLDKSEWIEFESKPESLRDDKYILYYALRNDKELISETKKLSKKLGYNVYSIHPTCNKTDNQFIQLNDVGPKEFVYLINHANIISTNSFHAVSFSGIFDKKALYKSYSNTESRVPTILEHYGLEFEKDKPFIYNFQDADKTVMNEKIQYSKKFLKGFFEINE